MRILALSVFEGVVYHCWPVDLTHPCRPTLEVEAVLRAGDADEGPLLLTVADYVAMVGGMAVAGPCLRQLSARGRVVDHLGAEHIVFPFWTPRRGAATRYTRRGARMIRRGVVAQRLQLRPPASSPWLRLPLRNPSRSSVT